MSRRGFTSSPPRFPSLWNFCTDGDSIAAGYGLSPGKDFGTVAASYMPGSTVHNIAVSSQQTTDLIAGFAAHAAPLVNHTTGWRNLYIAGASTNDANVRSPASTWSNLQELAGLAAAAGYSDVCIPTPLYKGGVYTEGNANRDATSELIRAGASELSTPTCRVFYSDFNRHLQMNQPNAVSQLNGVLYQLADNVHPTVFGQVSLAGLLACDAFSYRSNALLQSFAPSEVSRGGSGVFIASGRQFEGAVAWEIAGVPAANAVQLDISRWSITSGVAQFDGVGDVTVVTPRGSSRLIGAATIS